MQNRTNKIKLIVFDVDGTLVDDNKEISQKTVSVIHELQNRGVDVSFATGKTFPSVEELVKVLKIKVPIILSNGALVQQPGREMVFCEFLSAAVIKDLLVADHNFEADLVLYTPDHIFVEKETFNTDHMKCLYKEEIEAIGDWVTIQELFPQICKAIWVNRLDIPMIKRLTEYLRENLAGRVSLSTATPDSIEVMPFGVSKKTGLNQLAEILKVSMEEVMVFGDQINDIGIIEQVGIGVAVGNAIDEVKAVSDYVIGTNNEGGPADFLCEYFNII